MAALYYVLGLLLFLLEETESAYCKRTDLYYTTYTYCPHGCCGTSYNRYCCTYTNYSLYIGLSIGGFILLVIILALICACLKSGTKSGRVIGVQQTQMGVMTVSSTVHSTGQRHPHGYFGTIPQPPPYSANPPPAASSAAYPPPYPPMGNHPPPARINPPPTGFHPPPAPVQGNPPPPGFSEATAPQPFTYSNPQ